MKIIPNSNKRPSKPPTQTLQHQQPPPPPPAGVSTPDLRRNKPAHRKPPRRRTPRILLNKDAAGKRAGPPTPLLRWKFDDAPQDNEVVAGGDKSSALGVEFSGRRARRGAHGAVGNVSVRKLAAALWRLQAPDVAANGRSFKEDDRLGFQQNTCPKGERLPSYHGSRGFGSGAKGQPMSPCSVNGPVNGYSYEPQASFKFSNFAMEGATKWDPVCPEKNEETSSLQFFNQNQNAVSMVSGLQSELDQARRRIEELESDQRSSKKKLKQFLLKLSEERAAWRSREHEKVRAIISDVKADLIRERKNCQRLEIVNSKLANELAEVKRAMKRYMQDFEKERKNREMVEEVCDELAKEIGEDKAEVDALKTECMKMREEVDDERKMLQMAEVWREERVQMKLIDAKVALEDKYSQMSTLIAHLKRFLGSKSGALDSREIKEAELLQQACASMKKIQDMKGFTYEPPKSGDILSIFEEMGMGETSEREIEPCDAYSPMSRASKMYNAYGSQNDDLGDDDRSGWETVSHADDDEDDQGSSFTPDGSAASLEKMRAALNMIAHRESNVSGSGTEWEGNGGDETPVTEVSSGVSSLHSKSWKKSSSISRLWRSGTKNGESCNRVNGGGDGWVGRKGYKTKVMEVRMEGQKKMQLRQVLQQNTS